MDVPHLRMSETVTARGEMRNMIDVFDSLAWKLTRQLDPRISVAEETFIAAGKGLHLSAFEQYIRGITEPDQAERLRHLEQAVKLSPRFGRAWMALGREDYNSQTVRAGRRRLCEGGQERCRRAGGRLLPRLVADCSPGTMRGAEKAFAEVARILPLAEVVNNEGVAVSRQGHDGTELLCRRRLTIPTPPTTTSTWRSG